MSEVALVLSIIASIGTIISLIFNFKLKGTVQTINKAKGDRNIQGSGANSINNTGDSSTVR